MRGAARPVVGSALLIALAIEVLSSAGGAVEPANRSEFMRKKLEYSKNVLEGLTREDFPLIARDARALRAMSEAAAWRGSLIPNAQDYIPYTLEFQRLTEELEQKAKAKNLDGATLAYVQLTMACVNCHKYARNVTK